MTTVCCPSSSAARKSEPVASATVSSTVRGRAGGGTALTVNRASCPSRMGVLDAARTVTEGTLASSSTMSPSSAKGEPFRSGAGGVFSSRVKVSWSASASWAVVTVQETDCPPAGMTTLPDRAPVKSALSAVPRVMLQEMLAAVTVGMASVAVAVNDSPSDTRGGIDSVTVGAGLRDSLMVTPVAVVVPAVAPLGMLTVSMLTVNSSSPSCTSSATTGILTLCV